jgi:tetratricopeptide (TPR) repeat protein
VFADAIQKTAQEYRLKGYQAQEKGNISEAVSYYSKAISLGTGLENALAYNDLGVLYERIDSDAKAEQCYLAAIQMDQSYLPAYMNLGYLYKDNNRLEKSFEFFKKRFEMGSPDDVWTEKAKEELLALRPEYQKTIDAMASRKLQEEAKALSDELLEKAHEDFITRVEHANGLYRKGQESFLQGNYIKAVDELQAALKITPDNPKIVEALKEAEDRKTKFIINEQLDQVKQSVDQGDFDAAKDKVLKVFSIIPKEPVSNPK